MTRVAVVGAFCVCAVLASAQDRRLTRDGSGGERRLALVVGNDTYATAPLANARNDARAVAAALQEVGFTVTLKLNTTRSDLGMAVEEFGRGLRASDVALFYFAGHGVQIEGMNYLVPVDYTGQDEASAKWNSMPVGQVQDTLRRAQVALIVLDACRNNPYKGARALGGGLVPMEARGTYVAFAADAGQIASDNAPGQNGLFTTHLIAALRTGGLEVREVFRRVRQQVAGATGGRQVPATYDGMLGDFYFRGAAPTTPIVNIEAPTAPPAPRPSSDPAPNLSPADLQRSCDAGTLASCVSLGALYKVGQGVREDPKRAAALYLKACDGNYAVGCCRAGEIYAAVGLGLTDDRRAVSLCEKGCNLGDPRGCTLLGYFGYKYGAGGVQQDKRREAALYQQGCDGGDALGCTYLGMLYERGDGVVRADPARAIGLYQKACDNGMKSACDAVARLRKQ